MNACGVSLIGPRHTVNQDSWAIVRDLVPGVSLFLVSDGVGGRASGEVASRYVSKALPAMLRRAMQRDPHLTPHNMGDLVSECVRRVSKQMRAHTERMPALAGMSATMAMLLCKGAEGIVAHLGDSRVYQLRNHVLTPLTADHTVTASLVSMGDIGASQAKRHPARHQLTRCIGMGRDPQPDVEIINCLPGDRFLLCSDGISKPLGENLLLHLMDGDGMPSTIGNHMLKAVQLRRGKDDATAVLVFV